MKVSVVVRRAREALAEGKCVVIGLQTTGESAETGLGLAPGRRRRGLREHRPRDARRVHPKSFSPRATRTWA